MTFAPVPSSDEIVRLYKAGELSKEIARDHEMAEAENDLFIQRCIALHNSGNIDLLSVPNQSAFASVTGHAFFNVQLFYCEAIPKLDADVESLMRCCRILIERAGADLAANQPNGAFRAWCEKNPNKRAHVICQARAGDELAKQFVTFALQAANDFDLAIDFVHSYADERRMSGVMALATMTFGSAAAAEKAIFVLESFIAESCEDHVRANALLTAFEILKKYNDTETARRLLDAAVSAPGVKTLAGLAQIVWLHHALLNDRGIQIALIALEALTPEDLSTLHVVDIGLRRLLGTKSDVLVLDFLTAILREGKLTVENFASTAHELKCGNPQRLYELTVRWFLSESAALCGNISKLIGVDTKFNSNVQPLKLATAKKIFLCRKAIGFLFLKPVACCSIMVSVLRAGDKSAEGSVTDLLFDPILLNYGGGAKDYLKSISACDAAYGAIQKALAKYEAFHAGLNATGTIKALHPSDYQREVARQRAYDEMREVHKMAESESIFFNLVSRSTILYGKSLLSHFTDHDGSKRAILMDLKPFGLSRELPRREIIDPVGLDYMLRVYRIEKL